MDILFFFSITLFFNSVYGQISITGKEHLLNSYYEAVGKNVTFTFDDDDLDNLFVIKNDKMKNVKKIFDGIEISSFIKGSKIWTVHGIIPYKKKDYLHISQKNNNIYIKIEQKDYVNKMRYYTIYDNLIDSLNIQNIYLKKNVSPINSFSKYLLCDMACHIKWMRYELINDTIYFFYSLMDKNVSLSDSHIICASSITQDKFVNKNIIEECLLFEQNIKDSIEDEKLHAFLVYQKERGNCDTVFLFGLFHGWHHNNIRFVSSTNSHEIKSFAPDSTYSLMTYSEYLDYVRRRGNKGESLRKDLAKYADSVNSVGFMRQIQLQKEREKELADKNNPLIAKPRVNEAPRKFLAKSAVIMNFKQWFYDNGQGKWTIRKPYTGDGRCKSLQLCSFLQNGEIHYTLKSTIASGEYRYPALGLDFIPYDEYFLYTFDKEHIDQLKNPNEIAMWVYSKQTNYDNYREKYTDNEIVRWLDYGDYQGYIWVQRSGNYIRFYVDGYYGNERGISPRKLESEVNSRYYEVPVSEWQKLFTIVK